MREFQTYEILSVPCDERIFTTFEEAINDMIYRRQRGTESRLIGLNIFRYLHRTKEPVSEQAFGYYAALSIYKNEVLTHGHSIQYILQHNTEVLRSGRLLQDAV